MISGLSGLSGLSGIFGPGGLGGANAPSGLGSRLILWMRADRQVYSGGARQFYSVDKGKLTISDNADLSTGDIDFTWAGWVYFDTVAGTQEVFGKWGPNGFTSELEYALERSGTSLIFYIGNGTSANTVTHPTTVAVNTWYFVVLEHDSVNNFVRISLNNGSFTSAATTIAPQNSAYAFSLGQVGEFNSNYYDGRLSLFGFWKRTLTAAELTYLYNDVGGTGKGRLYGELGVVATNGSALLTSMVSYWNLNETSGTANAVDAHDDNDLVPTFAEQISNPGFETAGGGGPDVFANWLETAGDGTISNELVVVDTGSHACSMARVTNTIQIFQTILVVSRRYIYTLRARRNVNPATIRVFVGNGSSTDHALTTSYATYSDTLTALTTTSFQIRNQTNAETVYIDNVSVKAVDLSAAAGPSTATDGTQSNVVDGDPVVSWRSIEGSAYNALQNTASQRPVYRASAIGGQPAIDFNGSTDLLRIASAVLTGTSGHVFIVYRLDAVPNSYQTLLASADEASTVRVFQLIGRGDTANDHINYSQSNNDTVDLLDGNTAVSVDTNYAARWASDGATITAFLNGTTQTLNTDTGGNNGDWFDDTTAKDNVTIGALKTSAESNFLNGKIAEIIVASSLTAAEIAELKAYITTRYGITF